MPSSDAPEDRTSNLQLAAMLAARGFEPVRVEGPPGRREFVFVGVPAEVLGAFHRPHLPVSPADLFAAYKRLRRLVFDRPANAPSSQIGERRNETNEPYPSAPSRR